MNDIYSAIKLKVVVVVKFLYFFHGLRRNGARLNAHTNNINNGVLIDYNAKQNKSAKQRAQHNSSGTRKYKKMQISD